MEPQATKRPVLVVEDELVTRTILIKLLQGHGYQVTSCGSAEEAIQVMERDWHGFLILDLQLPGMSGIDFCRWIRAHKKGDTCYILVGTASYQIDHLQEILKAGANDYVSKPYVAGLLEVRLGVAEQEIEMRAQRKELERALIQEKELVSSILDTTQALILVLDSLLQITRLNRAAEEMLGNSLAMGSGFLETFVSPNHHALLRHELLSLKETGFSFESDYRTDSGQMHRIAWKFRRLYDNQYGFITCTGLDVTDRHLSQKRLLEIASRDQLTKLLNRQGLHDSISAFSKTGTAEHPGTLLYLDLDHFKYVNDNAGHATGDQMLIELAGVFRKATRPGDKIFRMGGDEFAMILPDATLAEATQIAEQIRQAVTELKIEHRNKIYQVGISIGITTLDPDVAPTELMSEADQACYRSKTAGRNRVSTFEKNKTSSSGPRRTEKADILEALDKKQIELWYQPIVEIESNSCHHFEILLRLRRPDGDLVFPAEFLGAAERVGVMPQIDQYIITQGLKKAGEYPDFHFAINLSGAFLSNAETSHFLEKILSAHQNLSERIVFEITESEVISNLKVASDLINQIRARGFGVSLDDFGAGYSSFGYLRNLSVDYLKIDGSFVREMLRKASHHALVRAINEIAHHLNLKSIAEFVDSAEIYRALQEIGVDYAQGNYLGEPAPEPRVPKV